MKIDRLSGRYCVRRLKTDDIEMIYQLSCRNKIFYKYHPPFVTSESIREDIYALPPGKNDKDKYYIGFFQEEKLVAVMDLILDYPGESIAFIGLFMMNIEYQGRGIGSNIIRECFDYLKQMDYKSVQIGVDQHNPQSNAFWRKNGFTEIGESEYIRMEKVLKM